MSKIPCCLNHIGKHGRSGKVLRDRNKGNQGGSYLVCRWEQSSTAHLGDYQWGWDRDGRQISPWWAFTYVQLVHTIICSRPISKFKRLSILVANIQLLVISYLQHLPTYGTSGAFPFGRLTCVLSALPTSPWSIRPRNRLPPPAPALSGRLQCGWCCFVLFSELLLYLEKLFQ